jgi:feruloyl esterase
MHAQIRRSPTSPRHDIIRPATAGALLATLLVMSACAASPGSPAQDSNTASPAPDASACAALLARPATAWPDATARITLAELRLASTSAPAHCEVIGFAQPHQGQDGQAYRIGFHLRLPLAWNGRFLFQGGGGSNGDLGDALGRTAPGAPPLLVQGYAVVSQDSGHDNATNTLPSHGGAVAFGFDPKARADYGHASLKVTADVAKAAIARFYGQAPTYSYFAGCSKGGQEGMAFAQRYPDTFDGVLAAAPGFSLPRAAVAEAWDTQAFARLIDGPATPLSLARTFSDHDLKLAGEAVLAACDADDGLADGVVGDFTACSAKKVEPELARRTCTGPKTDACLARDQVAALQRVFAGPHDRSGRALYSDWAWDAGVAAPGWRMWKIGGSEARPPALNVLLGMPSLAAVFSTPPRGLADPISALAYAAAYDFDRDAKAIDATAQGFAASPWQDISARSPNLDAFRAHGGKMIVPHGVSDPVFSIKDTLAWYREVDARTHGKASRFVRVFPVPGMNHCGGGPATDGFNAFDSLVAWVEHGEPPRSILAKAGPASPWPGRTRPLCPYPEVARYDGVGSIEAASSFACKAPARRAKL